MIFVLILLIVLNLAMCELARNHCYEHIYTRAIPKHHVLIACSF